MKSITIIDSSGVGAGGITRVLTEVVRHWPAGQRVQVIGAPRRWETPADARADVEVFPRQNSSRRRTIQSATLALAMATSRDAPRREWNRVLSLSPSIAILGSRAPVLTIMHDFAFRLWPHGLSKAARAYRHVSYSTAIRRSATLACVSTRTQHDLLGLYGVPLERSQLWVPGSDVANMVGVVPAALERARQRGQRYLVIAGHASHKGVELALAALPLMPKYVLAVLTGGQRDPNIEELSTACCAQERIIFLDHLSDADYAATISSSAAFLMPSHFEGYGLPAVEAMRLGTPVIISPDPALHEATEGKAVRMVNWTAEALRRAVAEVEAASGPSLPIAGRTWEAAVDELFDMLTLMKGRSERATTSLQG